ncbi:ABC transporter ATP-binding protein [Paenibacillus sp. 1011MAR3C5]|uniref:staphylopine uptake ABC transporter ATP-binding protein CntD n=1 Tax=Paenibacillus sp. 1011MAR3C5 TaxID=1675787 RepID=UPI000E6BC900|nr:ABC transporter ATP-binding protein [Paenibacillus sp. 1011MAR3C5]RJE89594.1 ABC transporter ATP-binding protein [Paenibacillus sp. 1011MAR3C5]
MAGNVLEVKHLRIWESRTGKVLVPDSSFRLAKGECLGIVGESGSGKSLTCKAILRLLQGGLSQSGSILLNGISLAGLSEKEMRTVRGKRLCMIMQNGMRAFDPSRPVGAHLRDTMSVHGDWSSMEIEELLHEALMSVGLNDPVVVLGRYSHELSGGMLQRLMIALALALKPDVIIADEPTTALDAVTQFEVMEQFVQLRVLTGSSMLFVSHDLGAVKRIADQVIVMKDGEIVEQGTPSELFTRAEHPYTRQLAASKLPLHHHYMKLMGGAGFAER